VSGEEGRRKGVRYPFQFPERVPDPLLPLTPFSLSSRKGS